MAYYFAVETEEKSYVAKKIRNSRYFGSEYSSINGSYECTLEEIDRFTSEFKNEESLKRHLLSEEIISDADFNKEIAIIYSKGIKIRKVDGNILYSNAKNMLENPNEVVIYIKNKAKEKDSTFFRELSKKLPDGTINKSLVCKVASLIELSLTNENEQDLDNDMIEEIAKILIYRTLTKEDGSIVCTDTINTENLHNILSFVREYENTLVKTENKTRTLKNTSN